MNFKVVTLQSVKESVIVWLLPYIIILSVDTSVSLFEEYVFTSSITFGKCVLDCTHITVEEIANLMREHELWMHVALVIAPSRDYSWSWGYVRECYVYNSNKFVELMAPYFISDSCGNKYEALKYLLNFLIFYIYFQS